MELCNCIHFKRLSILCQIKFANKRLYFIWPIMQNDNFSVYLKYKVIKILASAIFERACKQMNFRI